LPLSSAPNHLAVDLLVLRIIEADGAIVLNPVGAPGQPLPVAFPAGSLLYVPRLDDAGSPVMVADPHVIEQVRVRHEALNRDKDTTKVNKEPDHPVQIFNLNPPCKSYRMIGVYEGGYYFAGGIYRPAGACKMRGSQSGGGEGEFCFVCKWLIVNRVDPSLHPQLDHHHYPEPSC
jgi:hypothetical protein